ncbi:hypothetical protein V6N13_086592 [Hibiscus sabdariffa]|uniref:Uncharacterized protein n=1 Tax=Hibiscus sabdariffa TaxID=183260 RepID=A0ABR2FTQ4_9ROSI
MSGSSVIDGSSVGQQGSHQDPIVQQMQQGASTATSLPALQTGQVSLPMGLVCAIDFQQLPSLQNQEPNNTKLQDDSNANEQKPKLLPRIELVIMRMLW